MRGAQEANGNVSSRMFHDLCYVPEDAMPLSLLDYLEAATIRFLAHLEDVSCCCDDAVGRYETARAYQFNAVVRRSHNDRKYSPVTTAYELERVAASSW